VAGNAFAPIGATVNLAATTASSRVAVPASLAASALRIYNSGSGAAFVELGSSTVVATLSSLPIAPGAVEVITSNGAYTNAAVILASGTSTVYFTQGEGV
jgi:hypothetical protein